MVGRSLQAEYYREPLQKPVSGRRCCVEAEGLGLAGAYRDVDFELHAGEILGIAGVIGSGREELTRTLRRLRPARCRHADGRGPAGAACLARPRRSTRGIGYIPRERRVEGLVLFLPVAANITLASLGELRRLGLIDTGAERRLASELGRAAAHPHARHRHALPQPFRRQPAEGGAGQVAERATRGS